MRAGGTRMEYALGAPAWAIAGAFRCVYDWPAPSSGSTPRWSRSRPFDAGRAGDLAAVQLRIDGEPFAATVGDGAFALARGELAGPGATIATTPGTLAAVLWHDLPLATPSATGAPS